MKKTAKPPKMVNSKAKDTTGRADNYQVSRSLPDLRKGPRPVRAGSAKPPKHAHKHNWKKIIKRMFIILFLIVFLTTLWLGYGAFRNSNKLGTNLFSVFDNSKLKGEDRGRINILLTGVSTDDPGHQGADLTDSIMIISINPNNKTAYIMSVPRDLYVKIDGNGYAKINAANVYGKADNFSGAGYPSGGVGLLEKTITDNFNIPIDYYAVINYTAFRDAVNAVGGVTITVASTSKYGVYDPYANLRLANGTQQIDGQTALNLSRARGEGPGSYGVGSDFDRTGYQRSILLALKDKANSVGVLGNPLKINNLFNAAGNNVKTDLSLGNIRRLNNLTKGINNADIKSVSLNNYEKVNYLRNYTTNDGQSTLIPALGVSNYTAIHALITQLNASTPTTPPASQ
jgi:polyisoprenyl-teichoic acid--peptidoglycan teichoic acid transferase